MNKQQENLRNIWSIADKVHNIVKRYDKIKDIKTSKYVDHTGNSVVWNENISISISTSEEVFIIIKAKKFMDDGCKIKSDVIYSITHANNIKDPLMFVKGMLFDTKVQLLID